MADYAQGLEFFAEVALGYFYLANEVDTVQNRYIALADLYYADYYYQRTYYFNNFQASGEAPFATEQFGIPFYTPDYTGTNHTGYFPPGVWFLFNTILANRLGAIGSDIVAGYWQGYGSNYTPNGAATTVEESGTYAMEVAAIFDDWNSYQNRYEEHKRDVFNERRWASQMGSLSYGVKEAYTVERGMGTAFAVFDEAQGQLISADDSLLNGLATFAGYRQMQKALRDDLGTVNGYQENSFLTNVIPHAWQ